MRLSKNITIGNKLFRQLICLWLVICKIGFGGGWHWCTEGVFSVIKGVINIEQGWLSSEKPNDLLSEGIIVHYDEESIGLGDLIEIHLHTHASTTDHAMRSKYRSAIYTFNEKDQLNAKNKLGSLAADFEKPIITQTLPFISFEASPEKYQDYYQKDPNKPFCQTYITPKIQQLMSRFKRFTATP